MRLRDLKGLGVISEKELIDVGILTPEALRKTGAVQVFYRIKQRNSGKVSLNFLYALVGAIEERHWTDIARTEKGRLLTELAAYEEMEAVFREK